VGEGWYRFFNDVEGMSCDLIGEGCYTNCFDKKSEHIKLKDQSRRKSNRYLVDHKD
jgi:hypothetical protein